MFYFKILGAKVELCYIEINVVKNSVIKALQCNKSLYSHELYRSLTNILVLTGILGSFVNLPTVNMKAEPIGPFGPMSLGVDQ